MPPGPPPPPRGPAGTPASCGPPWACIPTTPATGSTAWRTCCGSRVSWRWASAGSTTTTTIRPGRCNGTCSPPRSGWRTGTICRWSSTPGRRGTIPLPSSTPRPCRSARCSTASPAGPERLRGAWSAAATCRSRASSRSDRRTTCGPRPRCARSIGCWSRPTAPTWRRPRTAAGPTAPRWFRWWARRWPTPWGSMSRRWRRRLGPTPSGCTASRLHDGDAHPPAGAGAARSARAVAEPGAGAELRGRPQHGPPHRPDGGRRAGGPGGRGRPRALVANLPYNVATPLVLDLLAGVPAIERMLVMVQREVGERLAAVPGTKAYGIPSVKVAYRADAEVVGRVPATVFVPQPRVESVLVRLRRLPEPRVDAHPDVLFRLVEAGFGQRRKMLRRSLAGLVSAAAFEAAGVRPEARAEELGLDDWARLVNAL